MREGTPGVRRYRDRATARTSSPGSPRVQGNRVQGKEPVTVMSGPSRDLFHLLSYAENRATRRLAAALEGWDCSIEQWRVLALLADGRGHPMTELAEFALLPAPTATKLADRMVADTLVYRRADPADRRRVLVYLTERGREL